MKRIFILLLVTLLSGCVTMMWDGGFPDGEYTFSFKDRDGNPIEGVVVEVRSSDGALSFEYPVDEYVTELSLVTSKSGSVEFSHVAQGIEFGGSCHSIGIAEWGICSGPEYDVVFKLAEREVYRISYTVLSELGNKVSIDRVVY